MNHTVSKTSGEMVLPVGTWQTAVLCLEIPFPQPELQSANSLICMQDTTSVQYGEGEALLLPVAFPDRVAPGVPCSSFTAGQGRPEVRALPATTPHALGDSLKLTRWASVCRTPKKVMV